MDDLAITRFWMGGVIAVMVIYALIALVGHRRRRKPSGKPGPAGRGDTGNAT